MNAVASVNGELVLSGLLVVPRVGLWQARLRLDAAEVPTAPVGLEVGGLTLVGAVVEGAEVEGRVDVLLVGGAGGLGREVRPRAYLDGSAALTARMVAADILTECGEALSATAELGTRLPAWTRTRGSAGAALGTLARALGLSWRCLPDGTIWAGAEAWPISNAVGELLDTFPGERRATYAMETLSPLVGEVLDGRRVERVEHRLADGAFRTEVFW